LLSHASFYSTIALDYLAATFELPLGTVTALVSSMIWNEQLAASLDANSEMLILHREARSSLQQMALALADRISQALNENERSAAIKFGDGEQSRDGPRGDRRDQDGGQRRTGGDRRGRGRGRKQVSGFGGHALGRDSRAVAA
jgi:translation initiation factor 3 subunit C